MNVPPLSFCARNFVPKLVQSTPVLGYKPNGEMEAPTHGLLQTCGLHVVVWASWQKKKKKRKDNLISIFFQDILHRQRNILQILVENVFFVAARSRFFTG